MGCHGGYLIPRVLLMRVPEQMTEGQKKLKNNSQVEITRFSGIDERYNNEGGRIFYNNDTKAQVHRYTHSLSMLIHPK